LPPSALAWRRFKLNAVVERGVNDDDIIPLVEFPANTLCHAFYRVHGCRQLQQLDSAKLVPKKKSSKTSTLVIRSEKSVRDQGSAPSVDYEFVDGRGDIGVIASVTEPFCGSCTRLRLTADARLSPACSHSWVMTSKV